MLFKLKLFLLTLFFVVALELSIFKEATFFKVLFFLIAFAITVIWPITKKIRFVALPLFLSIGALDLLLLIDEPIEQQVFILISAVVYYVSLMGSYRLSLYGRDQTAQGMVNFGTLATIFFWYVSNYGWYLNFQIDTWILVLVFVVSTFLIGLPSLMICEQAFRRGAEGNKIDCLSGLNESTIHQRSNNRQVVFFLNIILSFVMGEVIWGLMLWPFSYLTTGVIALIIYFVLWDVVRLFIRGSFSKKAVLTNVFIAVFSVAGILLTAQWELVVN